MGLFLNNFYMEKLGKNVVKTHLSLLNDPSRKGRPTDRVLVQAFRVQGLF